MLPAQKREDRVVFLGDEVTENWGRGARSSFRANLSESWHCGANHAADAGPVPPGRDRAQTESGRDSGGDERHRQPHRTDHAGDDRGKYTSIVELAKANDIRVVLASLTPICDCYTKQTPLRPQGKIIGINGWLREYAAESGSVYLDYYSAMAEGRNLRKELTSDGLLPNDAVMPLWRARGSGYRKGA